MIAGVAKAYTLPFDYVLYDMSYVNVIMYSSVLPSYKGKGKGKGKEDGKKGGGEPQKVIKADDPANRDEVRRFFETCE